MPKAKAKVAYAAPVRVRREPNKTVEITNVTPHATVRRDTPTDISRPEPFYQSLGPGAFIDARGVPCRPLWMY